jgi:hypothetical protein
MTIFEFLNHSIFQLPLERQHDSYENFFAKVMNEYMELLMTLEDFEIHGEFTRKVKAKELAETAYNLGKGLTGAIREYNNGMPHLAFDEMKKVLDNPEFNFQTSIMLGGESFFRARSNSADRSLTREELFHVPFHLKHKIGTNRFSISGFPCLYLADSVKLCWEELGSPEIDLLNICRYRLEDTSVLFEIPHPSQIIKKHVHDDKIVEGVVGIGVDSLIMNFPLYFTSSMSVELSNAPYKIEYVIPQLLLQYVRQDSGLDGIKFFSSHLDYNQQNEVELDANYVFPVQSTSTEGYCERLLGKFTFSHPIIGRSFKESEKAGIQNCDEVLKRVQQHLMDTETERGF